MKMKSSHKPEILRKKKINWKQQNEAVLKSQRPPGTWGSPSTTHFT